MSEKGGENRNTDVIKTRWGKVDQQGSLNRGMITLGSEFIALCHIFDELW